MDTKAPNKGYIQTSAVEIDLPIGYETTSTEPRHINPGENYAILTHTIIDGGRTIKVVIDINLSEWPTPTKYWPVRRAIVANDAKLILPNLVCLNDLYPNGVPAIPPGFESANVAVWSVSTQAGYLLLPDGTVVDRATINSYTECFYHRHPTLLLKVDKIGA
jgi:hypothetical protein